MDHFSNSVGPKVDAVNVADIRDDLTLGIVGYPPVQPTPLESGSRKAATDVPAQKARVTCNENHFASNAAANPIDARGVFHMSIDVDHLPGTHAGAELLVRAFESRGVIPSIFIAGLMMKHLGDSVRRWAKLGCELGIHGWAHCTDPTEDFRTLPLNDQYTRLSMAQDAISNEAGFRPRYFRAPNLWMSGRTIRVLADLGVEIDSSVPSGRFDMFGGRIRTTRYLRTPRRPYEISIEAAPEPGVSGVIEVPLLSAGIPINMMSLRLFGPRLLAALSLWIARRDGYVIFYCHPAEVMKELGVSRSVIPARHLYRCGATAVTLLYSYLDRLIGAGLRPITLRDLAKWARAEDR